VASKFLSPISPLNGYSKEFGENILEEVTGLEIISLATSVENQKLLDQSITKLLNINLPLTGKSSISEDKKSRVIGLSMDQWLAIFESDERDSEAIFKNALSDDVYLTTQTDAWVILRISGPLALKALERVCPINLEPDVFLENDIARTIMEHLGSIVICEKGGSYLVMSASSSAKSFLHALETSLKNVN
tara:strand:+ start:1715 stop:2284 length:570 start_codon:yes stop_codon:yes gene_type:complete